MECQGKEFILDSLSTEEPLGGGVEGVTSYNALSCKERTRNPTNSLNNKEIL